MKTIIAEKAGPGLEPGTSSVLNQSRALYQLSYPAYMPTTPVSEAFQQPAVVPAPIRAATVSAVST